MSSNACNNDANDDEDAAADNNKLLVVEHCVLCNIEATNEVREDLSQANHDGSDGVGKDLLLLWN